MTEEEIIRIASKAAIDTFNKNIEKIKRKKNEQATANTRKLLKEYCKIRIHCNAVIHNVIEDKPSNLQLLLAELFDRKGYIKIQAITESKRRTELMLGHIDAMLEQYKRICEVNNKMYYNTIVRHYIQGIPIHEVAEELNISERTVWYYIEQGIEDMAFLLFGIDATECDAYE